MYRAVDRGNRITANRYQQRCKAIHKQRLKKIKSAIDNRRPKEQKHLKRNMKREQMMEGACTRRLHIVVGQIVLGMPHRAFWHTAASKKVP